MLSRFDIIFVLLDSPDQRRDERLSEYVMAMHSGELLRPYLSAESTITAIIRGVTKSVPLGRTINGDKEQSMPLGVIIGAPVRAAWK